MKITKSTFTQILLLFSMFTFHGLYAQSDRYNDEAILLRFSTFVKGGKEYKLGVMGEGLKPEMKISPEAVVIFKKYQRQRKWSLICSGIQLVTEVTALITHDKSLKRDLLIGGGGLSLINVPLYIGSYNNLNKAVWLRNKAVVNQTKEEVSFK